MTGSCRRAAWLALLLVAAGAGFLHADWAVQVAAFAEREYLADGAARLHKAGFPVATEEFTPKVGRPLTRLLVGPYPDRKTAEAMAVRLKALGWPGYVRRYSPSSAKATEGKPPAPPVAVASAPQKAAAPAQAPPPRAAAAPPPLPTPVATPAAPAAARTEVAAAPAPEPTPASSADEVPVPPPLAPASINLPSEGPPAVPFKLFGLYQLEGAYTTPSPAHGSKF